MALLDDLFLPGGFASAPAPVVTGLNDLTKEPLTEQEMMAAAREAAAQKLAGAVKSQARAKSPFPWAGDYAEPSPFPGLGGMGVLADSMPHAAFARDAVPEAPAEPEPGAPQAHINGIPLPRARPVEADGPAHFSLAPPMADGGTIPAAATPTAGAGLPVQATHPAASSVTRGRVRTGGLARPLISGQDVQSSSRRNNVGARFRLCRCAKFRDGNAAGLRRCRSGNGGRSRLCAKTIRHRGKAPRSPSPR
jgi:hypothetical protein